MQHDVLNPPVRIREWTVEADIAHHFAPGITIRSVVGNSTPTRGEEAKRQLRQLERAAQPQPPQYRGDNSGVGTRPRPRASRVSKLKMRVDGELFLEARKALESAENDFRDACEEYQRRRASAMEKLELAVW